MNKQNDTTKQLFGLTFLVTLVGGILGLIFIAYFELPVYIAFVVMAATELIVLPVLFRHKAGK